VRVQPFELLVRLVERQRSIADTLFQHVICCQQGFIGGTRFLSQDRAFFQHGVKFLLAERLAQGTVDEFQGPGGLSADVELACFRRGTGGFGGREVELRRLFCSVRTVISAWASSTETRDCSSSCSSRVIRS